MTTFRVTFYVSGRRFEVVVPAASTAHAKHVIGGQYPKATLIIAHRIN